MQIGTQETWVQSLRQEDPLEEDMANHSSILAWKIPWTEKPGRLQATGLQSWMELCIHTHTHTQSTSNSLSHFFFKQTNKPINKCQHLRNLNLQLLLNLIKTTIRK